MKITILLFVLSFLCISVNAQVGINEIMSNNQTTVADGDGDYSDWIEIFNRGTNSVNLGGYFLSDDPDSLQKWRIPPIVLQKDSFFTIWCSGKNDSGGANIHTNFSLDSQGETVFLSDPNGNVVDNFSAIFIVPDKSFGRLPDGSNNQVFLNTPTFRSSNNISGTLSGVIINSPSYSVPGGFYTTSQQVALTHSDPSVVIHYTLDGSDPTENSPIYSAPLNIQSRIGEPNYYSNIRTCYNVHFYLPDWYPPIGEIFKCTILRARAFKTGYYPSAIQTYSYFIDPDIFNRYGNLPVISVVSDPKNLFSDSTGIYVPGINYQPNTFHANYYKDWDRPANIEMYLPDGRRAFNSNFKININGQSSPSSPQKGLNVNASTDYGVSKIEYPLFENTLGKAKHIQKFDKIKLRAWGSDREKTLFRDAYCASFLRKSDLDYEAYRPVVVFLDGEYWGLQEMRERNRNGNYYQSHYLIDNKDPGFDILNGAGNVVLEGDNVHWDAMINFINSNSLSIPGNYSYVKTQMDVNSFMLKYVNSIYFAHGDWPDQNEGKWRPKIAGGKWKWMQWDMDNAAGYYLMPWYDMFTLVIAGARGYGPSDLLNHLLLSPEFKNDFINLFADYMNTEYLPAIAQARVDEMRNELLPYFNEYQKRWQLNYNWIAETDDMKLWVDLRPEYCKQDIISHFALSSANNLTLNVSDTLKGNIKVNTILLDANTTRTTVNTYPWTGQYFVGAPVPLKAIAKAGYRFINWLPSNDTSRSIILNMISDTSITAMFDIDPDYNHLNSPVINEVMSSNVSVVADNYGEYNDWLEIFNPNNDTIDLAGYYLTDNLVLSTRFKILENNDSTKIPPHGYLLIWVDDDTEQGILHTSFKFNAGGDFIALTAPDGETIIDSLHIQNLSSDVSYGRSYDASPQFILFNPSTPNASNQTFATENILINELQTINLSTIADNYNEYNQWIELYNPTANTIDLAGWKITNDTVNNFNYTFPYFNDSTKIIPFGFKLLWADSETNQGVLHMNFSLQQDGCIRINKPIDAFSDSKCYISLNPNASFGRVSDGNPLWINFFIPTPDSNNVILPNSIKDPDAVNLLYVYPNPLTEGKIFFNRSISFTLYDVVGRELSFAKNKLEFDMSPYDKGIYFIRTLKGEIAKIVKE